MWKAFPLSFMLSIPLVNPLMADLSVYPGADPAQACSIYQVRVIQGDRVENAFVYQSESDWDQQSYFRHKKFYETLSYAGFAFTGEVTVEVTKVGKVRAGIPIMAWRPDLVNPPPPAGVIVRPLRFGIEPKLEEWTTRFTIDQPGQYSVEFVDKDLGPNGTPLHGLMIFADPPEDPERVPDQSDANVLVIESGAGNPEVGEATIVRFEAGVHELGPWVVPANVRQIYLAPGAFVKGCFSIRDRAAGFILNGRGVLSAHHMGWHAKAAPGEEPGWYEVPAPGKDYLKLLIIEGDNLTVDGIVLADSPFHTVGGKGSVHSWSWVKVMGWRYNNDGIPGFEDSVIKHCFIRANDDAVWLYHDNLLVHDLVMWQGDNGACFQLGWNSKSVRNVTVRDIDVIHAEWGKERRRNNSGLLNLRLIRTGDGGPGVQEAFLFENINVESPAATGIDIRMRKEAGEGGGAHTIRNFVFRNVSLQLAAEFPFARNYLIPWDDDYGFENIVFDNVRVNGVLVSEANFTNEGRFDIAPVSLGDIEFRAGPGPDIRTGPLRGLDHYSEPSVIHQEGEFILFTPDEDGGITVWSSEDLNRWRERGALPRADWVWGKGSLKEPRAVYDPTRRAYFMVFTLSQSICLASTKSLDEPWVILTPDQSLGLGTHPALFIDDGGQAYLVVDGIRMAEVDLDSPVPVTDWVALTVDSGVRPTVLKKNGLYHLFWTDDSSPSVIGRYTIAHSVMGPYQESRFTNGGDLIFAQPFTGPDGREWVLASDGEELIVQSVPFDETANLFDLGS